MAMVACNGQGQTNVTSDKEQALQKAMAPYVKNTVVATYSNMANEGMKLLNQCEQILDKVEKNEDYATLMQQAERGVPVRTCCRT